MKTKEKIKIASVAEKVIRVQSMVEHANVKSPRIMENADLLKVFGLKNS